jgi:3-oxoacyl-[acyl-carrier protein] reductase
MHMQTPGAAATRRRVAAVTGGSRGLGKAIVAALSEAGCDVAFCYRTQRERAEETAAEVEGEIGRRPLVVQADITEAEARERFIGQVQEHFGALDILVNNAGATRDTLALRMREEWDQVVELDLTAPFRLAQLALRIMMKASWGRIINIGSIAAAVGLAGQVNYTAAKAGLEGMTRSLAQEYGRRGITVNTVNPGFVETELTEGASELVKEYVSTQSATGRFVSGADVAHLVTFLASDKAAGITGQSIHVDGGLVKR